MGFRSFDALIEKLRNAALRDDGETPTDSDLLECYLAKNDDSAFECLVRRHGPLVYGVCRRVLGNPHDAEDAFQAAFLVLARKASSVRNRRRLGNWLYGVAYRTALHARSVRVRRQTRETPMRDEADAVAASPIDMSELLPLLDEALNQLPEHYRRAVILCELQGKLRKEAADQLGIPEGTLSSRLAKARQLLAKRLARHAPTASVAVMAGLLAQAARASCVPAASVAAASNIPHSSTAEALALAQGVLRIMLLSKIKNVALGLVLASALVWAGALIASGLPAGAEDAAAIARQEKAVALQVIPPTPKQEKSGPEPAVKKELNDQDRLQGTWRVVTAKIDGNSLTEAQLKNMRLKVSGDGMMWDVGDETIAPNKFTLAPMESPKQIVIRGERAAGFRFSVAMRGNYKLEDDKLWICVADEAKPAPKGFASEKGDEVLLCALERDGKAIPDQVIVAKGEASPIKISAVVPGGPPTLTEVNTGRFRVRYQLENTGKEPLILWPYLTLNVLDDAGQPVRLSRNLGRHGVRFDNKSILERVPFVTLQPGATHTFDVALVDYRFNSKVIQSWQLKAAGDYVLDLQYRYKSAEAKKDFGAGSQDIDNPKNAWNRAYEIDRSMQIKVRVLDSAPAKEKEPAGKAQFRERMFDVNGSITRIDKATETNKKNRVLATIIVKGSTVPVQITLDTKVEISHGKLFDLGTVADLMVGDPVSVWFKSRPEKGERRPMPAERIMLFRPGQPPDPNGPP